MIKIQKENVDPAEMQKCNAALLSVQDALAVLNGRWKLPILITLSDGPKRFTQIAKELGTITDKVLSKELKELEMDKLITRTVYESYPPRVEYNRTEHSRSLSPVIESLRDWGVRHRKEVIG